MKELNKNELVEINGGSDYSYELGKQVGEALQKAVIVCGIIALFL